MRTNVVFVCLNSLIEISNDFMRKNQQERILKSQSVRIDAGVPQGSILGALLFILYLNNPDNLVKQAYPYLDDTKVVIQEKKRMYTEVKIVRTINLVLKQK